MGFDVQNFGIGVLAGWGTAYVVYRSRNGIKRVIGQVRGGASSAQQSATQSADSRYINDMIEKAETSHLGGAFASLSAVAVEPRFIPAPQLATPPDDEAIHDIFRVVPLVHDHPYLHAPYNIDTLSIDEIGQGSKCLALLGLPGSGRSTALHIMTLHALGKIDFKPPSDKIQEKLDSAEAALSEKERAVRVKERITMQQRARERLANEKGLAFNATEDDSSASLVPLFNRLMPVYVHLADLLAQTSEFNGAVDPAEPLVRAVQFSVKRVTASTIPRNVYKRVSAGKVLLLADGFDELAEAERPRALAWLKAYKAQYVGTDKDNFMIVTGNVIGSGAILDLGFTPIYLRPWNDQHAKNAVAHWAVAWSGAKKGRKSKALEPAMVERAQTNNRALLPAEVTMKTWATYSGDAQITGYEGWLRTAISRLIPSENTLGMILPQLGQLAMLQLDDGYITVARMQSLKMAGIEGDSAKLAANADVESLADEADGENNDKKKQDAKAKPAKEEDAESASSQGRLLASFRKSGLLVRYRGDRYQFRHVLIAQYLGSLWLKDSRPEELTTRQNVASWQGAFGYMALHSDVTAMVQKRVNSTPDVLNANLLNITRWLAYAPTDVLWRGEILRLLGTMLIQPNQFPLLRERVAAAIVDSRDKNAALLFRRAVRNVSPEIRRLACLGLGAVADPAGVKDLKPLVQDQFPEVALTAGMALGAVGTEEALEAMIYAFTEGSEQMRQAMAEAFAALPEEGYPLLYEGINDQDMMLRRASVFGLRRLKTTWALVAIYRAFLEDEQWYVRSAAQQAFQELQYGRDVVLTTPLPSPDRIDWLKNWAAQNGENVPAGDAAMQMLVRALQEGEPIERALAAINLGELGAMNTIKALYAALRDRQDEVRASAHRALGLLEMRSGQLLPSPV
jgi:HEAT repeat protein